MIEIVVVENPDGTTYEAYRRGNILVDKALVEALGVPPEQLLDEEEKAMREARSA
jgi:hypothetical protein